MAKIKIKTIEPYENTPYLEMNGVDKNSRHGANFFKNVKQLQVGYGSKVFRVDRDGMWAGAETFAGAPWKVDWDGNMTATSVSISGYIPTGQALDDIGTGNITGTYIADGAIITDKLAANSIIASKIDADAVTADKIQANAIDGMTITGAIVQTDDSDFRVRLSGVDDELQFMNGGTVYSRWKPFAFAQGNGMIGETQTGDAYVYIQEGTVDSAGIAVSGGTYGVFVEPNDISLVGDVSINGDLNMNNDWITSVGRISMAGTIDLNNNNLDAVGTISASVVQLSGGGYIDNARAIYMETGRTTNPSVSGEIRYYDGDSKGYRGYVNGFLGQFDLSAV